MTKEETVTVMSNSKIVLNHTATRLLIVEDDRQTRIAFYETIHEIEDLELAAETGSETKALQVLSKEPIDAVILDLELEEGSGIDFMMQLQHMEIHKPVVVVITNVRSLTVQAVLLEMGVDFIYVKDNPQYGPKTVLDIVLRCTKYRRGDRLKSADTENNTYALEEKKFNKDFILWNTISADLKGMGFSIKGAGTTYLTEAIFYIIKNGLGQRRMSLTKEIYPMLAKKYKSTHTTVERNIRTSIESAWARTAPEKMTDLYPYTYSSSVGRPTNMEFMYNMSELINQR